MGGAGFQAFYRRVKCYTDWELGFRKSSFHHIAAGLAEPALQRFQAVAALPTCYFPPRLSL